MIVLRPHRLVLLFGIALPLFGLCEEWTYGLFRVIAGDLVTRPGSAAVAMVLVISQSVSIYRLYWQRKADAFTAVLAGISLALSLVFALALYRFYPIIFAATFYGIGVLGWTPLANTWIALTIYSTVKKVHARSFPYLVLGIVAGAVVFAFASIPEVVVGVSLRLAQSGRYRDVGESLLRKFGNEHDLLRAGCQPRFSLGDLWLAPLDLLDPLSERKARRLFTRISGKPFESKGGELWWCVNSTGQLRAPNN